MLLTYLIYFQIFYRHENIFEKNHVNSSKYFRCLRFCLRFRCFLPYRFRLRSILWDNSIIEYHPMPKLHRLRLLQRKWRKLPKKRCSIPLVMSKNSIILHTLDYCNKWETLIIFQLTFGVIMPTNTGAIMPVNAAAPFVSAIKDPWLSKRELLIK